MGSVYAVWYKLAQFAKVKFGPHIPKKAKKLTFSLGFPIFCSHRNIFKGKKLLVVANTWVEIMELGIPQLFEGQYLGPI